MFSRLIRWISYPGFVQPAPVRLSSNNRSWAKKHAQVHIEARLLCNNNLLTIRNTGFLKFIFFSFLATLLFDLRKTTTQPWTWKIFTVSLIYMLFNGKHLVCQHSATVNIWWSIFLVFMITWRFNVRAWERDNVYDLTKNVPRYVDVFFTSCATSYFDID